MNFTLKQVQYFVATAEVLSINKASKELNRSQSAVTNAIGELESALDVKLFNRSHNGLSLTHEGHQFLISARQIMASVKNAINHLTQTKSEDEGHLVIGVTSLLAGYYVSEPLSRFSHQFPQVSVRLLEDEQRFIEHQLVNGEIDVGILMHRQLLEQDAFETETLVSSSLKVWLPVNHPLNEQDSISLSDLKDEPMISLTANQVDQVVGRVWRRYNATVRPAFKTESVESLRNLVGVGLGLAIVPEFAYRPWTLDMQRIETRPIREELPTIDIGLVWRRGTHASWTIPEFISVVKDYEKITRKSNT